jgi:Malectin domain
VIGLELIQGGGSTVVAKLVDGVVIKIPPGTTPNFGVNAVTTGSPITSVVFGFNDVSQFRFESSAPYAMCGNDGPLFFRCSKLLVGTHNVTATVTNTGSSFSARFQIVNDIVPTAPIVTPVSVSVPVPVLQPTLAVPVPKQIPTNITLQLIYTPNNTEIMNLVNGSVVDLSRFPTASFNIKADTIDPRVQSLRFLPSNKDESARPFCLCGNVGPQYNVCPSLSIPGSWTITVEPYTGRFQSGEKLPSVQFSFIIRNGTIPTPPAPVTLPSMAPMLTPMIVPVPIPAPLLVPILPPVPVTSPITNPTRLPTKAPTRLPSKLPTKVITRGPSKVPTRRPSIVPIRLQSKLPTRIPSKSPTRVPIITLTKTPTLKPTRSPTRLPTLAPRLPTTAPLASVPNGSAGPNVTLTLVYSSNNTDVAQLKNGMVINASLFETLSFNIRADSTSANIKSIRFFPIGRDETSKPWAFCGNVGPLYNTCDEFTSAGTFTVTARPYSGTQQTGVQYPDVTITFSIVGTPTPNGGFPLRINCGGPTIIDIVGQKWLADSYFSGGATYSQSAIDILNTENDAIYRSERFGNFLYSIAVPIGSYSVVLHFAEI